MSESTGTVRLSVPAQPEFVSVARLTLAGVASRLSFDVDQVEDIRLAVAEAMTLLLRAGAGNAMVELEASWSPAQLDITLTRDAAANPAPAADEDDDASISLVLMEALMDSATVTEPGEGQSAVRLSKARTEAP